MPLLKTTYKREEARPLPAGWTEHKAPTGHTYYYNAETKQSTYTRPTAEPDELQIDYGATAPDREVEAGIKALEEFRKHNDAGKTSGQFTGGRSYQDRTRRDTYKDRPKSKKPILNCEPWILVMTKYKRRFVHNTETKESLWKFPNEVMMAVIEMEKQEWQAKKEAEQRQSTGSSLTKEADVTVRDVAADDKTELQDESDSYEEVEVTDDEDAEAASKRLRLDDGAGHPQGPVEMDEDDMAYQLALMEDEYVGDEDDLEAEEAGLELTNEDSIALFRSLMDDMKIGPYSTFDALIENSHSPVVQDDRWIALPNMGSRRQAFADWSRDRIAEQQAKQAEEAARSKAQPPRAGYLLFLREHATPKLYWPEFKRKYKKEPQMKDLNVADKDKERLYRDFVSKLKGSEKDREREFVDLIKTVKVDPNASREDLLEALETDLRFHLVSSKRRRGELIEIHQKRR